MCTSECRTQARAWARLARAAAAAEQPRAPVEANHEIQHAATEGRLDLRDLVDAYTADAPTLTSSTRGTASRTTSSASQASRKAGSDARTLASSARFPTGVAGSPCGSRRTTSRSPDTALSDQDDRIEQTRVAVADVLDGARAADASDDELDAFIQHLRVEHCDLVSVVTAAAWLAAERARLAQQRRLALPTASWATRAEIADHRGARSTSTPRSSRTRWSTAVLTLQERGVVVTSASREDYKPQMLPVPLVVDDR